MKAAQFAKYGDPSVIVINDVPDLTAGPGQVLVKVAGASLNPFDSKLREGYMLDFIPLKLPITIGGDIAGTVAAVGEGVTAFQKGDAVYGSAMALAGDSGAFAEYALTKPGHIAHAPGNVSPAEAASLVLVGVSALQGLQEHIKLAPGQKILITGGSGGVGTAAIELAKELGAHVATTVSQAAIDYARERGADEVIAYETNSIGTGLHGYDAIFDTVGGDVFAGLLDVLRPGGVAVTLVGPVDDSLGLDSDITVIAMSSRVSTAALVELARHIEDGVIMPHIAKQFPLDQARQAFTARETERVLGKVVLVVE